MNSNNLEMTKNITGWVERMTSSWNNIKILDVDIPEMSSTVYVGQKFPIKISVDLGDIKPEDISVEIISGRLDSQEQILGYSPIQAQMAESTNNGTSVFEGEVICGESGRFGITARIIPKNDNLPHTIKPKMISWW